MCNISNEIPYFNVELFGTRAVHQGLHSCTHQFHRQMPQNKHLAIEIQPHSHSIPFWTIFRFHFYFLLFFGEKEWGGGVVFPCVWWPFQCQILPMAIGFNATSNLTAKIKLEIHFNSLFQFVHFKSHIERVCVVTGVSPPFPPTPPNSKQNWFQQNTHT